MSYIALACASCAFYDMTKIRWTEFTESRCGETWVKVEQPKIQGYGPRASVRAMIDSPNSTYTMFKINESVSKESIPRISLARP